MNKIYKNLSNEKRRKSAFTLAEVLITLGIIGIVAVLVIPRLIDNYKERQYDVARRKALAKIGEAGRLIAIEGDMSASADSETFVKNFLSKRLVISKMCDSEHLTDCGWANKINVMAKGKNRMGQTTISPPKTAKDLVYYSPSRFHTLKTYGFVTSDGYSFILFYNPNCKQNPVRDAYGNGSAFDYVCMNAIYDMNGKKAPNQVGKDVGFVSVLYPDEGNRAVAPNVDETNISDSINWKDANNACKEGYTLPDKEELQSIVVNGGLLNTTGEAIWSSKYEVDKEHPWVDWSWYANTHNADLSTFHPTVYKIAARCVKR